MGERGKEGSFGYLFTSIAHHVQAATDPESQILKHVVLDPG